MEIKALTKVSCAAGVKQTVGFASKNVNINHATSQAKIIGNSSAGFYDVGKSQMRVT